MNITALIKKEADNDHPTMQIRFENSSNRLV